MLKQVMKPLDIHAHWWFKRSDRPTLRLPEPERLELLILAPLRIGRPALLVDFDANRSTRRHPSHWELPEV
jgi:hypothetical protein